MSVCFDKASLFGWMSATDGLFLDNSQCENRESKEEENDGVKKKKCCREMGRRRGE